MKLKVKLVSFVLVALALVSTGAPAFAATLSKSSPGVISPNYVNTDFTEVNLSFSGDRADCGAAILAKTGTTKITATVLLKRVVSNGTVTVKSWKSSASGDMWFFDQDYYVSSGYDYILEVDAAVTKGGTTEYLYLTDWNYCG